MIWVNFEKMSRKFIINPDFLFTGTRIYLTTIQINLKEISRNSKLPMCIPIFFWSFSNLFENVPYYEACNIRTPKENLKLYSSFYALLFFFVISRNFEQIHTSPQ